MVIPYTVHVREILMLILEGWYSQYAKTNHFAVFLVTRVTVFFEFQNRIFQGLKSKLWQSTFALKYPKPLEIAIFLGDHYLLQTA